MQNLRELIFGIEMKKVDCLAYFEVSKIQLNFKNWLKFMKMNPYALKILMEL